MADRRRGPRRARPVRPRPVARRAATILLVLASVPVGDVPAAGERGGAPALGRAPRRPPRWAGPVMVVNDNGAWCWFQDQRVVLTADGRLLVGSVPGTGGPGGAARAGTVEIATVEPGTGEHHVDRVQSGFRADDHDAPALIELPDRSVVAAWAAHSRERVVHVARR
ncbi:MAG: hypothetical protein JWM05_2351, partial [Acidimicrobiales bacterium]|nr:hypothetical protein [Acidimicrobiales bacterium]